MQRVLAFDVGQRDLGCCLVDRLPDGSTFRVIDWDVLDHGPGPVRLAVSGFCGLVHRWWRGCTAVDICVIEQQTNVNKKMLALSHAIQAAVCVHSPHTQVVFASPKTILPRATTVDVQSPYRRKKARKENSIRVATALLASDPEHASWLELLQNARAGIKDDLADSLLYAVAPISPTTLARSPSTCNSSAAAADDDGPSDGN